MTMEAMLGRGALESESEKTGKCYGDKYDQSASNNVSNDIIKCVFSV